MDVKLACICACVKGTCKIPLVFAGGQVDKAEHIRALLPDAIYSDWEEIIPDVEFAIQYPPHNPVIP